MQEIKLWKLLCQQGQRPKADIVEGIAETVTEQLLEDALIASPELLMSDLTLIGRQTGTPGGPLDLLGVDEDGRLVVFELKRGNLTREAVTQAIDYASFLAVLQPEELSRHISEASGKGGTERIQDFGEWYLSHFQHSLTDIGAPRIVLVGLGVDERAKRMVEFLAKSELDISLLTFHGFKHGDETLLARQVEIQSSAGISQVKSTKVGNQAKLDKLLSSLAIKQNYDILSAATKKALGDSAYQWPNATGYSFYLPELSASGGQTNRAYLALYAPESRNGKIQVLLQARAIEAADGETVQQLAKHMGTSFVVKPAGWGEIWIDGHKSPSDYLEPLTKLAELIAAGWRLKTENQEQDESQAGAASA